jgi:hypothetical protein
MMMAGLVAAHETTANATANAVKLLLQHPKVWQEICADPSLIPNAVEECLRHNGSVAAWRRLATKDVVIGGQAIPAGSKLLIVTSSANHDEQHFVDADLFDIHRDNASDHLTFGYGSHQCMGKNLARMEMQIFLEEFTRRLPHMQLAEQRFTYVPNTSFRGPEHLWVQWDVSRNPERANPAVLAEQQPVRIGESSQGGVSRSMLVDSTELIAQDVLRVRLKAPDGRELPRWTPGSHIDLHCGDTGISRQYSLCGDPQQADTYEIAVLREEHSRGGSAWVHGALQAGMKVQMRGPRNHFKLDESAQQLILVAGGIGITPVAAMAARAQALGIPYEIHYSCSQRERMALLDALQARHGERLQIYVGAEGRRADYRRCWPRSGPAHRSMPAVRSACSTGWPRPASTGPRTACAWSISPAPWERWTRTRSTALKSSCANPASRCRCATMKPCSMRCAAPISISSATAAKACAAPARCRCSKAISIIATWC